MISMKKKRRLETIERESIFVSLKIAYPLKAAIAAAIKMMKSTASKSNLKFFNVKSPHS